MQFGFGLPTRGPLARPAAIRAMLARAESIGLAIVSVSDHIVIPQEISPVYPYSDSGAPPFPADGECLEQLTLMAWIAAVTRDIRILSSVMVVPHRHPVHAAKTIATLDMLSGGRVTVGCGAGWMAEEFAALNTPPFRERGRVTDEYLAVFKELWTAEIANFDGEYCKFSNIRFDPKPVQKPHPPLWIGGESPAAKRRAVRLGDGWFPIGANPKFPLNRVEKYAASLSSLAQLAAEEGRDMASLHLGFWANWDYEAPDRTTPGEGARHIMSGGAEAVCDDIAALAACGVETFMFQLARPDDLDATLASLDRFAEQVLARV